MPDPKTDQEKKMAAAMAAVATYMSQEQQAARQAMAAAPAKAPRIELNLWGQSGRQTMMDLRNLMQLKALNRLR